MKANNTFFTTQSVTLMAVAVSTFMLPLDFTIVSVALHDIELEFGGSFTDLQWVVNGYTLMYAAMLMAGGTLADRFGRRLIYTLGIGLFMLSSLTCGLAVSPLMLNISRAFQGFGAALMFSASIPLLVQEFTGAARNRAFGVFGLVVGTGAALGPLLGGIIIHLLGWRWAFLINIPVGLGVMALIFWKIREAKDPNAQALDIPGFLTFTLSFLGFIYIIIMGNDLGWGSLQVLIVTAISSILFIAFLVVEQYAPYPMVDLKLFKDKGYIGISIVTVSLSIGFWWMLLYVPLYYQAVLNYSPLKAGAAVLSFAIPLFVMGPLSPIISRLINSRKLMTIGLLMVGAGAALMLFIPEGAGWLAFVPGAILSATGTGMINAEIINVAMAMAPKERSGMASGITGTMRQLGIALGFAGMGAIFTNATTSAYVKLSAVSSFHHELSDHKLSASITRGAMSEVAKNLTGSLQEVFIKISSTSFFSGFHTLLYWAIGITLFGALSSFILIPKSLGEKGTTKEA